MAEKQKVRFVRIRGRIVPIKEKRRDEGPSAGQLAGGGIAATVAAGAGGRTFKLAGDAIEKTLPGTSQKNVVKFSLANAGELHKLRARIVSSYGSPMKNTDAALMAGHRTLSKASGQRIRARSIFVSSLADEGVFQHELAHLRKSRQKGSANYAFRRGSVTLLRDIHRAQKGDRRAALRAGARMIGRSSTTPFTRLLPETEATVSAFKRLRASHGTVKALGKSKLMLAGQATYWLAAAGTAALYAGIGKAVFGKKEKK